MFQPTKRTGQILINHLHQFKQIGRKSRLKNRFSPWSRIIVKNYRAEASIRLVEHFAEIH